jgi:hypothetical protein
MRSMNVTISLTSALSPRRFTISMIISLSSSVIRLSSSARQAARAPGASNPTRVDRALRLMTGPRSSSRINMLIPTSDFRIPRIL